MMRAGDIACMECGRRFRTVKAAERAQTSVDGCPGCGGSDIQGCSAEEAAKFNLRAELRRAEDKAAKLAPRDSRAAARAAAKRDNLRLQLDEMEMAS